MKKFSVRIGDLEVKSCAKDLTEYGPHVTAKILYHLNPQLMYVTAYWERENGVGGYFLKFVGSRPLLCNRDRFWEVAQMGQSYLDFAFEGEQYES
jgi:hypothetical protein